MNRKQWIVLGVSFIIIALFFSYTSDRNNCLVSTYRVLTERLNYTDDKAYEFIQRQEKSNPTNEDIERVVGCVIDEKVYTPFIDLFWLLAIICFIFSGLEPNLKYKKLVIVM